MGCACVPELSAEREAARLGRAPAPARAPPVRRLQPLSARQLSCKQPRGSAAAQAVQGESFFLTSGQRLLCCLEAGVKGLCAKKVSI